MSGHFPTRLNPSNLRAFPGVSQVVVVDGLAFIGGQVPIDPTTGEVVGAGDLTVQANQVFANLEAACRSIGGGLSSLVKTTTYITDPNLMGPLAQLRESVFGANAPANATIVVSGFAHPDMLIEIEAIAALQT